MGKRVTKTVFTVHAKLNTKALYKSNNVFNCANYALQNGLPFWYYKRNGKPFTVYAI